MLKSRYLLILTMSLMLGCQSTIVPIDTACSWVRPISTTAGERKFMTRETKEEIAAHNDMVDLKCSSQKGN